LQAGHAAANGNRRCIGGGHPASAAASITPSHSFSSSVAVSVVFDIVVFLAVSVRV
jgi:hypothetical protein